MDNNISLEMLEVQGEIIRMQSELIDKLYLLLRQHVDTDELAPLSNAYNSRIGDSAHGRLYNKDRA